jgi:beta-xylosidase
MNSNMMLNRPISRFLTIGVLPFALAPLLSTLIHKAIGADSLLRADSSGQATYTNPVIDQNFPDPSVLTVGGVYYAFSTNIFGENMPCERSKNLVDWTELPDAMPNLPDWAKPGKTWAPDVYAKRRAKLYVVYFCALDRATNEQAVGAAEGSASDGPFTTPPGTVPLVEQASAGGAIDPSSFVDSNGTHYLVWKNDGNSRGQDTWLWIQKLADDGLHLVGEPVRLIKEDQPWEGKVVEAPTLLKHGRKYYLFYSANDYGSCNYAVGYAVSDNVAGPYNKPTLSPFLSSNAGACGPGGEDMVKAHDGSTWMVYHVWAKGPRSYRCMFIDRVRWNGDTPTIEGPSHSPQPAPE